MTSQGVAILAYIVLGLLTLLLLIQLASAIVFEGDGSALIRLFSAYSRGQSGLILFSPICCLMGYYQVGGCRMCGTWYGLTIAFHVMALYSLKYAFLERILFSMDPSKANKRMQSKKGGRKMKARNLEPLTEDKDKEKEVQEETEQISFNLPTMDYTAETTEAAIYHQMDVLKGNWGEEVADKAELEAQRKIVDSPEQEDSDEATTKGETRETEDRQAVYKELVPSTSGSAPKQSAASTLVRSESSATAEGSYSGTYLILGKLRERIGEKEDWRMTVGNLQRYTLGTSCVFAVIVCSLLTKAECGADDKMAYGCKVVYPLWIGIYGVLMLAIDMSMFVVYSRNIVQIINTLTKVNQKKVELIKSELWKQMQWTVLCLFACFVDTGVGIFWISYDNLILVLLDGFVMSLANYFMFVR